MMEKSDLAKKIEALSPVASSFLNLYEIMKRLRSATGCPWDREQTPYSLRQTFIEETFEAVDAINENDALHVREELGDVFFNLVFIAECYEEEGKFSAADSLDEVCEKLIRRHPHVFSDSEKKLNSGEVSVQWEKIKENVEGRKNECVIDSVPESFPPLLRSYKILKKCAKNGFDCRNISDAENKVLEELQEIRQEYQKKDVERTRLEEELGDFLLAGVNLCRKLDADPNACLLRAIKKFSERYRHVEGCMKKDEKKMCPENDSLMMKYWNEAKKDVE